MVSTTIEHKSAAGRVAALTRSRLPDDPDLLAARRELAEASIADHIRKVVDGAPPLTDDQRDRLSRILRSAAP